MPTIPQAGGPSQYNRAQVGGSSSGADPVGQVLQQLGGQVSQFALNLMEKRANAEAADYARTQNAEHKTKVDKYYTTLKNSRADDGKIYTATENGETKYVGREEAQARGIKGEDLNTAVTRFAQKDRSSRFKYAPNDLGRELFENSSTSLETQYQSLAFKDDGEYLTERQIVKEKARIDGIQKAVLDNPDPLRAYQGLKEYEAETQLLLGTFDQGKIDEFRRIARSVASEGYFAGKANQISAAQDVNTKQRLLGEMEGILKGTKKASTPEEAQAYKTLADGLSGDQKSRLLEQLGREQRVVNELRVSDIRNKIDDLKVLATNYPERVSAQNLDALRGQISNSSMSVEEKKRSTASIEAIVSAGKQIQKDRFTDPGQWEQIALPTDEISNATYRQIQSFREEVRKERASGKRADYAVKYNPSLAALSQGAMDWSADTQTPDGMATWAANARNWTQTVKAQQLTMGFHQDEVEITTKEQRFGFMQAWQQAPGDFQKAHLLEKAQRGLGEDFGRFVTELTKDENIKISKEIALAAQLPFDPGNPDPFINQRRAEILRVSNPATQKLIVEQYKSNPDMSGKVPFDDLKSEVDRQLDDFRRSIVGPNVHNAVFFEGIRDAALYDSAEKLANNPDSKKWKEQIGVSINRMVKSNFEVAAGENAPLGVVLPKQINGREVKMDQVQRFLDTVQNEGELMRMGEITPYPAFEARMKAALQDKATPEEINQRFGQLIKSRGMWIRNDNFNGVMLVIRDDVSGQYVPITKANGARVEYSVDEISQLDEQGKLKKNFDNLGRVEKASEFVQSYARRNPWYKSPE